MRTYGRVYTGDTYKWAEVDTDSGGSNDAVWLTTLIQCLKLNLGESPFYAQYGLPAVPSVLTQIFPDYYMAQTQTQFAPHFASLVLTKIPSRTPTYNINLVTHQGAKIGTQVAV